MVIDNGSGTIKAGFAGQDHPKCFFPSFVGRPKHLRVMAGAMEGDTFIGRKAQDLRGLLKVRVRKQYEVDARSDPIPDDPRHRDRLE